MIKKILLLMILSIMATGCGNVDEVESEKEETNQSVVEANLDEEEEVVDPKDQIDLSLEPNEAGKIMVLMYHNIGEEEDEWVRTPDNFRKDLLNLYEKGYRPISLEDYVTGNITTAEGYTPVVLTFDDGNENNFRYLDNGEIDKDSAVGILLEFSKDYPDFQPHATFFLNAGSIFGQAGKESEKINFLIENGMDVGNHSKTHANFTSISKEELQKEIGHQAEYIKSFVDDESYKINTLALPFGSRPKDESLTEFLREGSYEGKEYNNIAILNVGWNPAFSPYDTRFNYESIPRIRASEMKVDNVGMYNYIEYFDNNPDERFISDGFSEIITVPEDKLELLPENLEKEIYVYEKKEDEVAN